MLIVAKQFSSIFSAVFTISDIGDSRKILKNYYFASLSHRMRHRLFLQEKLYDSFELDSRYLNIL